MNMSSLFALTVSSDKHHQKFILLTKTFGMTRIF